MSVARFFNKPYLLLQQIRDKNTKDSIVVAIDRTTWNIIKAELINMSQIVTQYEKQYQRLA